MSIQIPFHTFPPSAPPLLPSANTTSFCLSPPASHATDIWRKPTNNISNPDIAISTFNAPIIYKSIPLSKFKRCRVTFTATYEILYDQGGLVFVLPSEDQGAGVEGIEKTSKWVKTGVEFVEGRAWVSTVGCDRWADWSLTDAGIVDVPGDEKRKTVTLEMERNRVEGTFWIYVIGGDGKRIPLRENTWILSPEGNGGSPDREAWVGVFAATPIMEGRDKDGALSVEFKDWELELED
ncbi:hypothetical protein BKA65DRAFT_147379 [Rhexocercosporidium sp. MPI-PUGE-AT-0058]|nr:hypothetical protein BKA65DRAFT_147379 [Rhexocercosporidium sp. MPI-PUGE-AT-0058]